MFIRTQNKNAILELKEVFLQKKINRVEIMVNGHVAGQYETEELASRQLDNIAAYLYSGKTTLIDLE